MATLQSHQLGRAGTISGRAWAGLGVALAMGAFAAAAAAPGGNEPALARIAAATYALLAGGVVPAVYLVAALGLGRLAQPLFSGTRERWAMQLAAGLAIALSLSQIMGVLGLLDSFLVAAIPIGVGLVLLAHQLGQGVGDDTENGAGDRSEVSVPLAVVLWIPGAAILFAAACNPPGLLWASEFGGYDALSYHLQLPQEWIAAGRVWPVEHNVYSFLPGYIESAFVHVGALMRVPSGGGASSPLHGLVAGEGMALISCQLLHAGLTLCAAYLIARLTMLVARDSGYSDRASASAGALAGAMVLLTPWTVVVGSLAYNEMAMVALGAAALLAAGEKGITPTRRGLLVGLLVGVACGAKPTALFFFGVPAGIVLLANAPRSAWIRLVVFGSVAGTIALSPWLIRNALASGNPVFPFLTSVFGSAHWSAEQVARYAAGHSFQGSFSERIALSVVPDLTDPAGPRHRGLMHPQWAAFFPVVVAALVLAIKGKTTRRWGLILGTCIVAQYLLWLTMTHIQSRFLVPLLVPGAAVFGLAAAWLVDVGRSESGSKSILTRVCSIGAVVIALGAQTVALVVTFTSQNDGRPNILLSPGPAIFTGEVLRDVPPMDRQFLYDKFGPAVFINAESPRNAVILFVGESAPLYYRSPFVYATTWDTSLLASLMHASPGDGAAWTRSLLNREPPIRYVLYDTNMTRRFRASGESDAVLDPDVIEAWLTEHGRLIRSWSSQHLFELVSPQPSPQPHPIGAP
jgi:hypothetical protein